MAAKSSGFRLRIFPKLFLAMIGVALIPLGSLWYINNVRVQQEWKANIESKLRTETVALVDMVENWVETSLQVLNQNALLEDIISMDASRKNPILKSINKAYPRTYLVITIAINGQNIGRNDGKKPTETL